MKNIEEEAHEPSGQDIIMPVIFVGHGNPMNAIEDNEFTRGWREVVKDIPLPKAILCISAHWETRGTLVTAMPNPRTIYDFGGFPEMLYQQEYNAPGSPGLAKLISERVKTLNVGEDLSWGLDHGSWSVLMKMYPNANIPVVQLSLSRVLNTKEHFELGRELSFLREKGVLIIGSGNIVHNLRMIAWERFNDPEFGYNWAIEADNLIREKIMNNDSDSLIQYQKLGKAVSLAIPTPDHFLPLLYILGMKSENENLKFFNKKALMGSLTMTSLRIG